MNALIIQDLSPEFQQKLKEISEIKEISLQEAFEKAQRLQWIWSFSDTEDAVNFLFESSRLQQQMVSTQK
jgi:hypothetical protein